MEITKFDIGLIFSLSLTVIFLSMTAPMLNLAGEDVETNSSEIPEFSINSDRFDIVGDFPDSPGGPSKGHLTYVEADKGLVEKRTVWLDGDESGGTEMFITNYNTESNPDLDLTINQWSSGSVEGQDRYDITNTTETIDHSNGSYAMQIDIDRYENEGYANFTADVTYNIYEQPKDTSWVDRIPVVGGIFSAGEALGQILGWIGSIIFWGLGTTIQIVLNLAGSLLDVTAYLFDTLAWLIGTYTGIIGNAPGWSAVIVTAPGILLFFELAKLVMVGISLLPTT